MAGIASAATSVAIGYVAGGTKTIRVGSGGVMLPNHAPLVIAEQFGTLASLFPGRIDLGLGRAPGTDGRTAQALRREHVGRADTFPQDVLELQSYFQPLQPGQLVRAVPGAGLNVPIWLLGSSLFSAQLAAYLGLPFAFASHFAPDAMLQALAIYLLAAVGAAGQTLCHAWPQCRCRRHRRRGGAAVYLAAAAMDAAEARQPRRPAAAGQPMDELWSDVERAGLENALGRAIVGSTETVTRKLKAFIAETAADEIIMTSQIYDHQARLRSFEIVAQIRDRALPSLARSGWTARSRRRMLPTTINGHQEVCRNVLRLLDGACRRLPALCRDGLFQARRRRQPCAAPIGRKPDASARRRADWAQQNGFESFPAFAVAVVIAAQVGVTHPVMNWLTGAYVALRIVLPSRTSPTAPPCARLSFPPAPCVWGFRRPQPT